SFRSASASSSLSGTLTCSSAASRSAAITVSKLGKCFICYLFLTIHVSYIVILFWSITSNIIADFHTRNTMLSRLKGSSPTTGLLSVGP
ncbi:hypothetical protein L9F63_012628, partial [Diploptera punctata]